MHQHAKGYTDAELERLASYFFHAPQNNEETTMTPINRRHLLAAAGGSALALALAGCATPAPQAKARVVAVVGAGFGGATAAKYIRLWGLPTSKWCWWSGKPLSSPAH